MRGICTAFENLPRQPCYFTLRRYLSCVFQSMQVMIELVIATFEPADSVFALVDFVAAPVFAP